ncbi:hypothetical protein U3A55_12380 [Salarchaeum sp. III]|uniref:hypothetical protein n=1 Tax=Salarchaeum sp. III TaxID=3107927 RepID=UPI002ED8E6DE
MKVGMMRKSGSWQSVWDDRILEYLREKGPAGATTMKKSDYFDISRGQISDRLGKLRDHHLVQEIENGVYRITDRGEAYLDEEYDAASGAYIAESSENSDVRASEKDSI